MIITVVGAGTTGSFAAAHLKKYFPEHTIRLLHSDEVGTIGVGESVTPPVKFFMDDLGADEQTWMRDTGSIYKYANCFKDWTNKDDEQYFAFSYNEPLDKVLAGDSITFPDIKSVRPDHIRATDVWLDLYLQDKVTDYSKTFNPMYTFMNRMKAPFLQDKYLGSENFSYAYHVDAEKLGPWVRDNIAFKLGVEEIKGTIKYTTKHEDPVEDLIKSVVLTDGREFTSDLWIDATGFHRLLIKQLTDKTIGYPHCPANASWVGPMSYTDQDNEMKNYTQSIWQEEGWLFKIGLRNRMGTGLVFSTDHINEEDALQKFIKIQDGKSLKDPRLIKWHPGRVDTPAKGNVVAIGMAAGFVEPMEANALFVTVSTIWQLNFAMQQDMNWDSYNKNVGGAIDDIADFLSVHYTLCPRTENTFWTEMRELGRQRKDEDRVYEKYMSVKNTIESSSQFLTIFPDYMWLELATSWDVDVSKWKKEIPSDISEEFHSHLITRNTSLDFLANECPDYAGWMRNR